MTQPKPKERGLKPGDAVTVSLKRFAPGMREYFTRQGINETSVGYVARVIDKPRKWERVCALVAFSCPSAVAFFFDLSERAPHPEHQQRRSK